MGDRRNILWLRWILANAFSELVGLGATFATIGLFSSKIDNQYLTGILFSFVIAITSSPIEATIVGFAQWWAMHPWFPAIRRFVWWRACRGYFTRPLKILTSGST